MVDCRRSDSNSSLTLAPELLEPLNGGTLFYPCSGSDWLTPLTCFSPWIREFWFVDKHYFAQEGFRVRVPRLTRLQGFELLERRKWQPEPFVKKEAWPPAKQRRYRWIEPLVVTRRYLHLKSGKEIVAHARRGYAVTALRQHVERLAIFFYRGDSLGEGGSGTMWLEGRRGRSFRFTDVLDRLVPGGLVVTDGSNCSWGRNPYKPLAEFHDNSKIGSAAANEATPFTDPDGRRFECMGYAGERYGPTLVWKVTEVSEAP